MRNDEVIAKFDTAKAELKTSMTAFKRLAASKKGSLIAVSDSANRLELEKLESDFNALKTQHVILT